jgi:hypothetical protein
MERLLYASLAVDTRIDIHAEGAILFTAWSGHPHRTTKDIDLLGNDEPLLGRLEAIFRDLCSVSVEDDGIVFDPTSVTAVASKKMPITKAYAFTSAASSAPPISTSRSILASVTPSLPRPLTIDFPLPFDSPAPRLRAYRRQTVVVEKLEIAFP